MEMLPAQIAMQMAMTQQNVALSMVKKTAEMQQQIADMLLVAASGRGGNVNISA
jgi:hypothetical protein